MRVGQKGGGWQGKTYVGFQTSCTSRRVQGGIAYKKTKKKKKITTTNKWPPGSKTISLTKKREDRPGEKPRPAPVGAISSIAAWEGTSRPQGRGGTFVGKRKTSRQRASGLPYFRPGKREEGYLSRGSSPRGGGRRLGGGEPS